MQQDDPWSLEPAGKREEAETPQPTSLAEALLALDWSEAPVFAVLDGAQFDNLPQDLMMGGFVSRPLYLDRGDNNPEQIITAPHMVWLDERGENVTGRAPKDTIPALLDLIADRPAAVFWQCPEGGEALYKHLRGINMVMYPKEAITTYEQQFIEEEYFAVLFRHADANVLAQTLPMLVVTNQVRFFGPATLLICTPEIEWLDKPYFSLRNVSDGRCESSGMMRITIDEARAIAAANREGLVRIITVELARKLGLSEVSLNERVRATIARAGDYEISEMEDLYAFVELDLRMGAGFESKPDCTEVLQELSDLETPPGARIYYAEQACNRMRYER